jgi:hypothetical protein
VAAAFAAAAPAFAAAALAALAASALAALAIASAASAAASSSVASYRGTMICGMGSGPPPASTHAGSTSALKARAVLGTVSWSSSALAIVGVTGCETMPTYRMVSMSTHRTVCMRAGSVLRSDQGACVSMYRFACCTSAFVCCVIRCSCISSASSRSAGSRARAASSIASSSALSGPGVGTVAAQCLYANERVRYARLPRSFESFALMMSCIFSCEKSPSEPKGTSLTIK